MLRSCVAGSLLFPGLVQELLAADGAKPDPQAAPDPTQAAPDPTRSDRKSVV
jgi:hypothetical protein